MKVKVRHASNAKEPFIAEIDNLHMLVNLTEIYGTDIIISTRFAPYKIDDGTDSSNMEICIYDDYIE